MIDFFLYTRFFSLGFTRFYWVLLSFIGFYWVLLGFTGFYWVLLGFTGFSWLVSRLAGFNGVFKGFDSTGPGERMGFLVDAYLRLVFHASSLLGSF